MRCSGWSSLAISACSALALAAPATAHVTVVPPFVSAGDTANLRLTAPNERDEPMTGFAVRLPGEFRIVEARSHDDWSGVVQGSTATWRGGSLAPGDEATFALEVEGPTAPGPATLEAEQRYPGGEVVRWPVALTVTPAAETSSPNLGWVVVTALIGLAVLISFGVIVMRRARQSERSTASTESHD